MNDFDGFLELELKAMLDSVVATRPPLRTGRRKAAKPVILPFAAVVLVAGAIPVIEPGGVSRPRAPRRSLSARNPHFPSRVPPRVLGALLEPFRPCGQAGSL